MKILIAGATGLIGKELVRQCEEEGISVHYLTTNKEKLNVFNHGQGFYWNPHREEMDTAAFQGVTAVINLAGAPVSKRWTKKRKEHILGSRLMTSRLIYETLASSDHQVTQYLSASGISIYPSSYEKLYTEKDSSVSSSFLGQVVVAWEKEADAFQELGIKVAKVRTGIVLDKNEGALPKLVGPIKKGFGAALGNGKQWQSWIHVTDMAAIYLFLLKNGLSGVYNGVSPSPSTQLKMTQLIASQLKKPLWMPKVPSFMLKLMLGKMSSLVLESQLVSSEKLEKAGYPFLYVNLEKALEDLL
ncbi:TIGR01777 family oxidoreductase [Aureisphaera galaxeae]|uniref:TIGR01777 family oxidoreductase n=1 Tax=Aureisphaera galaxeae TaxID=1538023 RepID=UPI0023503922|nr:TIGR01777 family oxidoreductase [Aureisphaera galaxeae]MDC8006234.1 TIGR01777 family oxidoreductase [Aureisphaera galaxeae]